ncbi:hypothetical protein [Burkholderia gladioli]|nr:hypothetical protein [Burkholderia gladioli]
MTQQTEPDAAITYTVNKRMPFQRFNCKHETSTVCERSVTSAMMSCEGHE